MNKANLIFIFIIFLLFIPTISIAVNALRREEITPNDEFFTLSISGTPEINIDDWKLLVDGLVENELELSYENITSYPSKSVTATLKCVEGPAGRAKWTGVRLKYILDLAVVLGGATEVVFYAEDGYSSSLTLDDATADDVLLAYEMNGEVLPPDHGYPVRLVVPGKYGYKWVKWIKHIDIVGDDFKGYWESRGWDDEADLATYSDWITHASLLSIGFIFGGLSLISGYKRTGLGKLLQNFPAFINARFHQYITIIYLAMLFGIFIYWGYSTYISRGSLFYTAHGILAGIVIILHSIGGISGIQKLRKYRPTKGIHRNANVFGFVLYGGVIFIGLFLAYGT
jgi:hypothetical protein